MLKKPSNPRKVVFGIAIVALLLGVTTAIVAYSPIGSFVTGSFAKTTTPKTCSGKAPKCSGMVAACKGETWICVKTNKVPTPPPKQEMYTCRYSIGWNHIQTQVAANKLDELCATAGANPSKFSDVSCTGNTSKTEYYCNVGP